MNKNIKYRDLDLIPVDEAQFLVIACDSCGGIGSKPLDTVHAPPQIVARLTARVVLMEILSSGAVPIALTAAICSEPEPTGEALLEGIREALAEAGCPELPITISTEKNIPTQQTGLGMTAVGLLREEIFEARKSKIGCHVYTAGLPKVGQELADDESQIADFTTLKHLLTAPEVLEIWPVGSRGILAEGNDLAAAAGGKLRLDPDCDRAIDLHKSAGTCTTLLFTTRPDITASDLPLLNVPCFELGSIEAIERCRNSLSSPEDK